MPLYSAVLLVIAIVDLTAIARLVINRNYAMFPWLTGFLVYQAVQTALAITLSPSSLAYQRLFDVSEPLNWVFYILIVKEMYNLAFSQYRGIASVTRWATYGSIGAAVMLSFAMIGMTPASALNREVLLGYIIWWEKCGCFGLSVFLVFMIFLLSRYPIRIDWNLAANIAIFTIYFIATFVTLQISTSETPFLLKLRNYLMLVVSGICFAAWGIFLRRPTAVRAVTRAQSDPESEQRLMSQLSTLNNLLLKSVRQ